MATEKRQVSLDQIQITPLEARAQIRGAFLSEQNGPNGYLIDWLAKNAYKDQTTKVARTYLIHHEEALIGYLAVSSSPITFEIPDAPRNKSKYQVQGLLLGRLFITEACQGQGVGDIAIRYAIDIATIMNDIVGCAGIVVDSDSSAVGFYEKYGFKQISVEDKTVTMFFKLPLE